MNAIILGGVRIGNNVIIGAGSLASKDIPDNCVAVGNPCKPIYSLEEYYRKRCEAKLGEAVSIVKTTMIVMENCLNKKFYMSISGCLLMSVKNYLIILFFKIILCPGVKF